MMKLEKLDKKNVRTTRPGRDIARLDDASLKRVVGGRHVDPETCAIHFYYPADGVE